MSGIAPDGSSPGRPPVLLPRPSPSAASSSSASRPPLMTLSPFPPSSPAIPTPERPGFATPPGPFRNATPASPGIAVPAASPSLSSPYPVRSPGLPSNLSVSSLSSASLSAADRRKRGKLTHLPPVAPSVPASPLSNPVRTSEIAPAPQRKKRKLSDKLLHDKLSSYVPESAIYNRLLELEKKVDATLFRKKLECQEALRNPTRVPHTLRVYIFNTHANQQPSGRHVAGMHPDPPSWTLHISGRLLDTETRLKSDKNAPKMEETEPNSQPSASSSAASSPHLHPFSTFLKKITVELNPSCCLDNPFVSWSSTPSSKPVNAFEIKRRGNKEFIAKIQLEIKYIPERFRLSDSLKQILGISVETKSRITASLWQYIKGNKLQDPTDPSVVKCDNALRKIFGEERIKFFHMSAKLANHLSPPDPIVIYHQISLTQDRASPYTCYDITLDFPSPLHEEMKNFLESIENHKDIADLEDKMEADARQLAEHCRKRAFFLGFSTSPVDFIHALIASQSRDLRQAAGESARNQEKERKSDFYAQPWVEDAVLRYLNRKIVTRTDLLA